MESHEHPRHEGAANIEGKEEEENESAIVVNVCVLTSRIIY